jgi:hypothetical protein
MLASAEALRAPTWLPGWRLLAVRDVIHPHHLYTCIDFVMISPNAYQRMLASCESCASMVCGFLGQNVNTRREFMAVTGQGSRSAELGFAQM